MSLAVADTEQGMVTAIVDIDAPPEKVFRALTDAKELASWWGSADTYRTFDWSIDLRAGGKWSCATKDVEGNGQSVRGEYLIVDPVRALSYTWQPSWEDFWPTTIRYDLDPTVKGTHLRLKHTGFKGKPEACKSHEAGWNRVLRWLADGVEKAGG